MKYLKIKEKLSSEQLSALGNHNCFEGLSRGEANTLIHYCREDSATDCDEDELQNFIGILSEASKTLMHSTFDDNSYNLSPISKASLIEKANALQIYLDKSAPDWQDKMRSLFSGSVLRIVRLIFGCQFLDCSVLYHLDRIIDEKTVKQYNMYMFLLFGVHPTPGGNPQNRGFYQKFYSLDYKQSSRKHMKQLEKLRSITDFKRAKVKFGYFDWGGYGTLPLGVSNQTLSLQSAHLNCIQRVYGLLLCDYHVSGYFGAYFSILNRLIPDEESFDKAVADGFFTWSDVDWEGFHFLMRCADDTIYCEDFYFFVERVNKIFYNYTGALFRDLREKMLFEPVTFYFAIIGLVFSFLSFIQVLQQANIIPPLAGNKD